MVENWMVIATTIALWNFVVFLLFGIDKYKATRNKWRISEKTLILSAFLMGGLGSLLGMKVFRHKTKHWKFKILVPLAVFFNIAVLVALAYLSQGRPYVPQNVL